MISSPSLFNRPLVVLQHTASVMPQKNGSSVGPLGSAFHVTPGVEVCDCMWLSVLFL